MKPCMQHWPVIKLIRDMIYAKKCTILDVRVQLYRYIFLFEELWNNLGFKSGVKASVPQIYSLSNGQQRAKNFFAQKWMIA